MKNITLKKLIIKNFKGIKAMTIDFETTTDIFGGNGTGKSTIFDAFTWLLFDRDSQDRNKFDIQPLDKENNVLHRVEVQVTGVLEVQGKNIELSKVMKERWVKRRGQAEAELKGTENLYYKDGVPLKMSEYKAEINKIIDENIFKLITNPLYFSSNMKWQERRAALLDMIGDVSTKSVLNYKPELSALEKLLGDSEIEAFKKIVIARKKKLNDDIKQIPSRIDELHRTIVQDDNEELDFEGIDDRKGDILKEIKAIEAEIAADSEAYQEFLKGKNKLYELKNELRNLEDKAQGQMEQSLRALKDELNNTMLKLYEQQSNLKNAEFKKDITLKSIEQTNKEIEELRAQWTNTNKKQIEFSEEDFICPTCNRRLEADSIEELKEKMADNFNANKAKALTKINMQGKALSKEKEEEEEKLGQYEAEIDKLNISIKTLESQSASLKEQINNYIPKDNLKDNQQYIQIKKQIREIEESKMQSSAETAEIGETAGEKLAASKAKKTQLEIELQEVIKLVGLKEQTDKVNKRINELTEEQNRLIEQCKELENQEFLCEEFIRSKVELLEKNINSKFKFVKFKLFNSLVNGAVEECCEVLVDGVPFGSANTAGKYNAGLDIINTLSKHYKVSAPIFIDGRESINEIIKCNSQIINLKVTKDKKLQINKNQSSTQAKVIQPAKLIHSNQTANQEAESIFEAPGF